MKYSLCIGAYKEKDFEYHLEKVREHGLDGLEYYKWWELDLRRVLSVQERLGVGLSAICTKFVSLVDQTMKAAYLEGLTETLQACRLLGVKSIISQTGNHIEGIARQRQLECMVDTLKEAAPLCEEAGVVLEIEPLNGLVNHKGYFLQRSDEAAKVIDEVNSDYVKLCFDIYHQQITEGNVTRNATTLVDRINHYHIADNPGRNEPGTGELNYKNILEAIAETEFNGFVGVECTFLEDPDRVIPRLKYEVLPK